MNESWTCNEKQTGNERCTVNQSWEWFNVEPSSNHKVGVKVEQWIKKE